jgi:protein-histidine N-methyltransferase
MASDPLTSPPAAAPDVAIGLGDEDIRTKVYEGGLKSWECSVDLAEYLHSQSHPSADTTLELGCGTALPSLALFRKLLLLGEGAGRTRKRMVLADYNEDVLQLVTLPNLLLTWVMIAKNGGRGVELPGDLDVSDELKLEFAEDLERKGIELAFVSGGWGNGMLEILNDCAAGQGFDLVLASETIYSPDTTPEFVGVLLGSLKKRSARGLVAAKRIYFGVGGSVEDFVWLVGKRDAGQWSTRIARDVTEVGVGRVIVEVTRKE